MFGRIKKHFQVNQQLQRVSLSLARGSATGSLRNVDLRHPLTWEFSAFSQNCEDGIIDILTRNLTHRNRYFVEIGASFGTENNTSWLAVAHKYYGLFVEADKAAVTYLQTLFRDALGIPVQTLQLKVTPDNVGEILSHAVLKDPDVFSLDIDGNDYYVAQALLDRGMRPKILVLEYNSAFGPDRSITVKYLDDVFTPGADRIYYGVSISGWKRLLAHYGYQFITVESKGVNAFFVDPRHFDSTFLGGIEPVSFRENISQYAYFRAGWEKQFESIRDREYKEIE